MSSSPSIKADDNANSSPPLDSPVKEINSNEQVTALYDDNDNDAKDVASSSMARKAKLSDLMSVLASGCALISDGYQNSLMTMLNPLFTKRYGSTIYSSAVSTRVSNSLLVGAIIGQISVG